jgi:hypothetical protein
MDEVPLLAFTTGLKEAAYQPKPTSGRVMLMVPPFSVSEPLGPKYM